jgi:hypothetical protein
MNVFKYGLIAVLAAGLTSCPSPTPPSLVVSGANSIDAGAPQATYTATATPSSTSGTIQWTLNPVSPGGGTLSASTSPLAGGAATVQYTPPATVATPLSVTLTGTLQGGTLVGTKTFTVNPPVTTGVTVNGTVLKWSGKAEGGVNITILDGAGNLKSTASAPDGTFTVANVITPYQVSAIPTLGTGIVPLSNDKTTITTPIIVVRKNAFAIGTPPGFQNECTPVPLDGTLRAELNQPVGAGNTGEVVYIAPGIDFRPTQSFANLIQPAGSTIFNVPVKFDLDMCYNDLIGTVVYIERNAGGTIVAKAALANVPIFPNTFTKLNNDADAFAPKLSVQTSNSNTLNGTATFPSGIITAKVSAFLRVQYTIPPGKISKIAPLVNLGVRTAYFPIETKTINNAGSATNWQLAVEDFGAASGLQYRAGVRGDVALKGTVAWSEILAPGASGVALNMPSISGTEQPNGNLQLPPNSPARAPGGNIIPEFRVAVVQNTGCSEGNNFLNNYIAGFVGVNALWLGSSDDQKVTLPDTNEPARIGFATDYTNVALNALCIREANVTNVSDKVLDGRGIQRNFYTDAALTNPDFIRAGVFNVVTTPFRFIN